MKMRGVRGNEVELMGIATLMCGLLLLAVYGSWGKRARPGRAAASGIATGETARPANEKQNSRCVEICNKLPLSFEENHGQTAREVRYLSRGSGYELFLTAREAVLALSDPVGELSPRRFATLLALRQAHLAGKTNQLTAVRLHFEGANSEPQIMGTGEMPGKVNYFIGNDPKKWHTDVPTYKQVKYTNIYPGIDLVFYGNQRRLEYDFVIAPGADPKAIRLNVGGARKLRVNASGDLVLGVGKRKIEFQKPVVYQLVNGKRYEIAGRYALEDNHRVAFAVGNYDRSEPVILDPVLNFSTYLGGSAGDDDPAITVDSNNNVVVAGTTFSTDFPTSANGFQNQALTSNTNGAAFVTEIDPTGTQLKYSTYLAGSTPGPGPFEGAFGVDVDSAGKIYVTGFTSSTDFPTNSVVAGFKPTSPANGAAGTSFITKLDPTATTGNSSLLYSSYIGGTNGTGSGGIGDFGKAVAADRQKNGVVYVTGFTDSTPGASVSDPAGFPVLGGFQTNLGSPNGNAFLAKIDTTVAGTASLLYSTYIGGNDANFVAADAVADIGDGVATDSAGSAYIGGITYSTNVATTTNATQPTYPTGNTTNTGFVARIDTTQTGLSSLVYLSYLGGASPDFVNAIALGGTVPNIAYVTGETQSANFPTTTGAFATTKGGTSAAFVTLIDTKAAASSPPPLPVYSTFVGGTGAEAGNGIKVDSQGNAYVGGATRSTNFPLVAGVGPFQSVLASGATGDGFVIKLSPLGNGTKDLLYSTYFGGSGGGGNIDQVEAIAIDASNNAYISGQTFSTAASFPVFPTTAPTAYQTTLKGPSDAFVAKLTLIPTLAVVPTTLNFGTLQIGTANPPTQTVTLTNNTNAMITFASASVSGGSPAASNKDYTVSADTCTVGIPAGASPANQCTITVKFQPTVVGTETAMLVLNDGDSTSPQNVSLTGSGSSAPPPDFTLSAAPTSLTVAQGAVGSPVTITVNPMNGFNAAVAVTCTGQPGYSSCGLNPISITPPTTSTLTFTAHAMLVPLQISRPAPPMNMRRIVPLFVALMLLFLLWSAQRLRTRLAMVTAILLCVTLAACSNSYNGPTRTAKGVYPVTVTGTSGNLTHNTTITITVD